MEMDRNKSVTISGVYRHEREREREWEGGEWERIYELSATTMYFSFFRFCKTAHTSDLMSCLNVYMQMYFEKTWVEFSVNLIGMRSKEKALVKIRSLAIQMGWHNGNELGRMLYTLLFQRKSIIVENRLK